MVSLDKGTAFRKWAIYLPLDDFALSQTQIFLPNSKWLLHSQSRFPSLTSRLGCLFGFQ